MISKSYRTIRQLENINSAINLAYIQKTFSSKDTSAELTILHVPGGELGADFLYLALGAELRNISWSRKDVYFRSIKLYITRLPFSINCRKTDPDWLPNTPLPQTKSQYVRSVSPDGFLLASG